MNSVLQQLFMVPSIRMGILQANGTCTDQNEGFSWEFKCKTVSIKIVFFCYLY